MMTIRGMTLGLLLVAGATAAAQPPQRGGAERPRMEGRRGQQGHPRGAGAELFRGIELSAEERARVDSVQARHRAQFEAQREAARPQMQAAAQAMREARQQGDTAAARAARARMEAQRASMQPLMAQAHADLRAALAPEHRAQFDANVARMGQRLQAGRGEMGPAKGRGAVRGRARGMRAAARVNLSTEERARIEQVRTKYRPRVEAVRKAMAPDAQALRSARQRNDTAAARAALGKLAQHRVALASLREQVRVESRAALSAEHRQRLDSLRARRGRRG